MPIGRAYQEAKRVIDREQAASIILTTRCAHCDWQLGRIGRRDLAVVPGWKHRGRTAA